MAKKCAVCDHKELRQINGELLSDVSVRKVADRFHINYGAVYRHKKNHLTEDLADLVASAETPPDTQAIAKTLSITNIISEIEKMVKDLSVIEREARQEKMYGPAVSAMKERKNILEGMMNRAQDIAKMELERAEKMGEKRKEELPGEISYIVEKITYDAELEAIEAVYEYVPENQSQAEVS